ncbi:MAG: HAD-IA family hydrolase [Clostridia bacterium]|nr:HAD-IA family hydrolase [Clostridia bacterium]
MKLPKMILFDYGQTLGNENGFDPVRGTAAVMQYATQNKYGYTAKEVQERADQLLFEIGRTDPQRKHLLDMEMPNHMFTAYLYESMGVTLPLTATEIDRIFWNAAAPAKPTEGIEDFLAFLGEGGIRTGVISNISYCGEAVKERIDALLPNHSFEFILATSEYLFRKPNKRIFELALQKADLTAEDVWYIGDQYIFDAVGAKNAGIFPVLYHGATQNPNAERGDILTVTHWGELKALMLAQQETNT